MSFIYSWRESSSKAIVAQSQGGQSVKYRPPQQGHSAETAATITRLKYRIKRLEEAGDAILNANNDDEQYAAMKQWYKAKEAKL
jgi:hypothetical protein